MDLKQYMRMKRVGYDLAEADRVRRLRQMQQGEWHLSLSVVHERDGADIVLLRAAESVQRRLWSEQIEFCFIGGVAYQRWGEVRFTDDIDLTVFCDLGDESNMLDRLLRVIPPRIDDIEQVVRMGRMYLGVTDDGTQVDISLGYLPYESRLMQRSVDVDFGLDESLRCCAAEDLVVLKTIAWRDQDRADLRRIVQRSGSEVDWSLVYAELEPLLMITESPERLIHLRKMVEQDGRDSG